MHTREIRRSLTNCPLTRAGLVAVGAVGLSGCHWSEPARPPCTPTRLDARDAAKVDLGSVVDSSVLTATLTSARDGAPVAGRPVSFNLRRVPLAVDSPFGGEPAVFSGTASTGANGVAKLDLKSVPGVGVVLGLVLSDRWDAQFSRDASHCGSQADAAFDLVASPVATVPSPEVEQLLAVAGEILDIADGTLPLPLDESRVELLPPGVAETLRTLGGDVGTLVTQLQLERVTGAVADAVVVPVAEVVNPLALRLLDLLRS